MPLSLVFLSSCFSSRIVQKERKIPIVDPVRTTIDTTTLAVKDTLRIDALKEGEEVCDSNLLKVAEPELIQDSLIVIEVDTLLSDSLDIQTCLSDTITIIGTGDIMPGTNYPNESYLPPGNDCSRLFAPVADLLKSADVTFGNLEGVFCSEGGTPKDCKDPKVCYVFRMPDSYLNCIINAGYNLLSVANNHVNDFGTEGRISTARLLQEAGVPFAGFQNHPTATFEIEGVKYGFAAFAPHTGTVSLTDYSKAAEIVAGLDSVCDIVIVSFHGGAEGRDYQHVPCTDEVFLGHNRGNVCTFAHTVVDAGADVVFGHGPHVTRAMELYRERLICYSLGNFCTYARFNLSGPNGVAPIVKVFTDRQGKFLEGRVIPIYQAGEGGPVIDQQKRAIALLRQLNAEDFPGNQLILDEEGVLSAVKDEKSSESK